MSGKIRVRLSGFADISFTNKKNFLILQGCIDRGIMVRSVKATSHVGSSIGS